MGVELQRYLHNPILTPDQVPPSHPDFEVVGTFNAGAIRVGEEVLLLVRVAERPRTDDPDRVGIPYVDISGVEPRPAVRWVDRRSPHIRLDDPRGIVFEGRAYVSTLSHLRLARSRDGLHFTVDPRPTLLPSTPYELYGMEDPRITALDGAYYVAYTSPSPWGVAVSVIRTEDFRRFERPGVIFAPENKDVAIFPGRASGRYVALHRPVGGGMGTPDIWVAYSPDLIHWGDHRRALGVRPGRWDGSRVGAGAVPIRTQRGWLAIYHGAVGHRYCLGTALFDLEQPHRLIGRSAEPIMTPIYAYEREGFFGSVVFTCGAVEMPDGRLLVYYGAGDSALAVAITSLEELMDTLEPVGAEVAA